MWCHLRFCYLPSFFSHLIMSLVYLSDVTGYSCHRYDYQIYTTRPNLFSWFYNNASSLLLGFSDHLHILQIPPVHHDWNEAHHMRSYKTDPPQCVFIPVQWRQPPCAPLEAHPTFFIHSSSLPKQAIQSSSRIYPQHPSFPLSLLDSGPCHFYLIYNILWVGLIGSCFFLASYLQLLLTFLKWK